MLKVGDIVKHNIHEHRFGIVVEIKKNTVIVEWFKWFKENERYMYYPYSITKVSS